MRACSRVGRALECLGENLIVGIFGILFGARLKACLFWWVRQKSLSRRENGSVLRGAFSRGVLALVTRRS